MPPRTVSDLPEATISESGGIRYLHLDTPWVQGAMKIGAPRVLVLEYVQRMMAWMLWRPTAQIAQGTALQLGLGAGAITRFTQQVLRMPTTVVELNAQVVAACRQWFHLSADSARLQVVTADAMVWLRRAPPQSVQVLCVDLYDHEAAAPVLDDEAFYRACRAVLGEGGVMSVNLFGRRASFARSMTRIAAAFGPDQLWHLQPTREGNTIAVATHTVAVPDRHTLLERADNIQSRFGLPARKWLRLVRPWYPDSAPA
ncbi:MAG: spermidine synthase [Burkholderiaceae bacterium]